MHVVYSSCSADKFMDAALMLWCDSCSVASTDRHGKSTLVVCACGNHRISDIIKCIHFKINAEIGHVIIVSDVFSVNVFYSNCKVSIINSNFALEQLRFIIDGSNDMYIRPFSPLYLDDRLLLVFRYLLLFGGIKVKHSFINKSYKTLMGYKYELMKACGVSNNISLARFVRENKFNNDGGLYL